MARTLQALHQAVQLRDTLNGKKGVLEGMNIMVDNSETLLDGYMQTKPSLYTANQSLRT